MQRRLRDRSCSTAETNMKRKDEPEKSYYSDDKERIQQELQLIKMENNKLLHENTKLKTQIVLFDKDLIRYEKICEGAIAKRSELLLIQLKKHNKDLSQQLKEKIEQVEHLKRNAKITKIAELEMENKVLFDELHKFKQMNENQQRLITDLNQKLQMIYQMNSELQRLQKLCDMQTNDNKTLNQKLQQTDELQKKQQIQLKNTIAEKDKRIAQLELQNKKLTSEKTNLKVTIQMLQERSTQIVMRRQQSGKLNPILTMELRFRLILRGIAQKQLNEMFEGLRTQAREQNITIKVEDFEHILSQEPFSFVDKKKVQNIISCIQGENLIDQFLGLIGTYETFSNFDFEKEQENMEQQLNLNSQKIQDYWGKKIEVDIFEVQRMITSVGLGFNSWQQLFYNLNLFEKSDENLSKIKVENTLNPFLDEDDLIIESQLIKNHPVRISEVSDEDHQD